MRRGVRRAVPLVAIVAVLVLVAGVPSAWAVTTITADNGAPWDVLDKTEAATDRDTGAILDGWDDTFSNWGRIGIRVFDSNGTPLTDPRTVKNIGLTHDGGRRFETTTPFQRSGIEVTRSMYAPADENYMRYVDCFENVSAAARIVHVAWGGLLGSGPYTTVAGTATGNLRITQADTWAVTIQNKQFDPDGPTGDGPVGVALHSPGNHVYKRTADFDLDEFTQEWRGNGYRGLGHFFTFSIASGATRCLAYFLYQGIDEENPPPGGGDPPAAGTEVSKARAEVAELVRNPDFGDLTLEQRARIINWSAVIPVTVTLDVTAASFRWRPEIVVTDPAANTSTGSKQTVTVKVTSETDPTGIEVTLTETGNDTSMFAGTVKLGSRASDAGADWIKTAENETVRVTYKDASDALTTHTVFTDDAGMVYEPDINAIWREGITTGCTAGKYCPGRTLTRAEMASLLARAFDLPAASRDYFTDDEGSVHEANINRIAEAGITLGCGGTRYCPSAGVNRAQMASFLARGLSLAAVDEDFFTDDEDTAHEDNINRIAAAEITLGCGGTRYCPGNLVTRAQMASFLARSLGLN